MKQLFLIIIFLSILACSKNKNENTLTQSLIKLDTVHYSYKGFNNGLVLDLMSNNTFNYKDYWSGCTGGGEMKDFFGKYQIIDDKLILKADSATIKHTPFDRFGNPIITKVTKINDTLKFKTEYQILKWNNTTYLLSEQIDNRIQDYKSDIHNDFERFADYYNSGYEPKDHGRYLYKTIDTTSQSETLDIELLPKKYRNLIFKEPLVVNISSLKKMKLEDDDDNEYWRVEIDKGKSSFVYRGLTLYDKSDNIHLVIDSITSNSSFGGIYNNKYLKNGIELRSRWNKNAR